MTSSSTRSALLVCIAVLLASLAVALLAPPAHAKADKRPTIVVGTDYDPGYPPFEMLSENGNSGKIVGFDIDIVNAIARKAGFKVEFQDDLFVQLLIPGLQDPATYDMVAAALTITQEREEYVDFSDPYFDGGLCTPWPGDSWDWDYGPWPGALFGFAFPTGSELREVVNAALQQIKDNGTYNRIFEKWFGTEPPTWEDHWQYNAATGHYYAFVESYAWSGAESYAAYLGGHLVTVNDAAEEAWLASTFPVENLVIGFNDYEDEGTWVWASGEQANYTNWTPGEPNNYTGVDPSGENYAVMNWTDPSGIVGWNDLPDMGPVAGIIEVTTVP